MGLVVGRTAAKTTVPTIIDFVRRRSDAVVDRRPTERGRPDVHVDELGPERCDALLGFFGSLPEGDRTFIKEEVTDPDTVRSWAADASPAGGGWVDTCDGDEVTGYVAVRPLPGWSDHVGEVRLVVSPTRRGTRARPRARPARPGGGRLVRALQAGRGDRRRAGRGAGPLHRPRASAARRCCATTSATAAANCAT